MPRLVLELKPVTRITTGAIGPPGKRVFYIQARKDEQLVTLIVEKAQVQTLALGVEQFLNELQKRFPDLDPASSDYDEEDMQLELPTDPAFRVGQIGLGYDQASDLVILVSREIQGEDQAAEEASVARFWCTRSQLWSMCNWGLDVANQGRPVCGNCGEPIDPEGHFCPKRNGHKH